MLHAAAAAPWMQGGATEGCWLPAALGCSYLPQALQLLCLWPSAVLGPNDFSSEWEKCNAKHTHSFPSELPDMTSNTKTLQFLNPQTLGV